MILSKQGAPPMMRRALAMSLFCATFVAIHPSNTISQDQGQPLGDAVRQAGASFQPVSSQDVARRKAELTVAVTDLDRFLRSGGPAKLAGWRQYLQWSDLEGLVEKTEPPPANLVTALLTK